MTLEVLLATMNQQNDSVLDYMKVSSDCVVCNQIKEIFNHKSYKKNNYNVEWYNLTEKGVGLNRNNALMRSKADICLIADDDVEYVDGYDRLIIREFEDHPEADMILFNVQDYGYQVTKFERIRKHNCGRFGGVRIAFRRMAVLKYAVSFNLLFGGGAPFSAGEDNMFIRDAIRKGLKVYASPLTILRLNNERESTWFTGYNKKFFSDMGSSYVFHYGKLASLCVFIQLIRHRNIFLKNVSFIYAYKKALEGIRIFNDL